MESADWAVSSAIFIVAVAVAITVAPTLLPPEPPELVESQIQDILEAVSDDIVVRSVILKTDCDSTDYDCNRDYPIELDIDTSKHNILSKAFSQDGNKVYTTMPLGAVAKMYSFLQEKIVTSYNTADLNLSTSSGSGVILVGNQHLSASITDFNAIIDFTDSNEQDLVISYPEMSMTLLKDTVTSKVVGNDANKFYLRFFPNSAEFWIDVPDDINVLMVPMHQNIKVDENVGVVAEGEWWDNDNTDEYIWHYRIPITVHSMDFPRDNLIVRTDINFALQMERIGETRAIDIAGFRLIEYSGTRPYDASTSTYNAATALSNLPFYVSYASNTEIATLTWTLTGFTPANSRRIYYFYFDFTDYPKTSYSYDALSYTQPNNPVYITVAFPQQKNETKVFDSNKFFLYNPNTLMINTVNQLSRVWQNESVSYRKPLLFDSGLSARSEMTVSADINFLYELGFVGCAACDLNTDYLSFVSVDDWASGAVLEIFSYSDTNQSGKYYYSYNPSTKQMYFSWTVPSTAAKTRRHYLLYYSAS